MTCYNVISRAAVSRVVSREGVSHDTPKTPDVQSGDRTADQAEASTFTPIPELNGFFVRVAPTGAKAYVAVARAPSGKQVWATIGGHRSLQRDRNCPRGSPRDHQAHQARRDAERETTAAAGFIQEPLPKAWIGRHVDENELRSKPEIERILTKYLFPKWAERPFTEIRRDDASTLMDKIGDRNGRIIGERGARGAVLELPVGTRKKKTSATSARSTAGACGERRKPATASSPTMKSELSGSRRAIAAPTAIS